MSFANLVIELAKSYIIAYPTKSSQEIAEMAISTARVLIICIEEEREKE
jgi:hypothetical protein